MPEGRVAQVMGEADGLNQCSIRKRRSGFVIGEFLRELFDDSTGYLSNFD